MKTVYFQNKKKKRDLEILWGRPFVFLNLAFFLVFSNVAFLYLYPLALDALGSKHHVIGLVMGVFSCAAVISRPLMGKLIISRGEHWVFSMGIITILLASLGYILITAFGPAMLLIRVVHGFGFSAAVSAGFSLAAKTFHPGKRGEAFSIIGASLMCAVALAPPLGELLIRQWGFETLYMAAAGAVTLAWLVAKGAFQPVPGSFHDEGKGSVKYVSLLKNRSFFFLLLSTIIFAHCQATVPNFITLVSNERGVPSGRFFLAANIVAVLVLLTTGKLVDRFGKLFFMKLSYPVFSLGILLIPGMIGGVFHALPAVLYGVGIAVLFSTYNALAASHGSESEKPAIMSLFTAIYDTGFITGAIVSGWFAHMTSLEMLFWACGIFGFIGFFTVVFSPIKEE
jgi:MFS family permease